MAPPEIKISLLSDSWLKSQQGLRVNYLINFGCFLNLFAFVLEFCSIKWVKLLVKFNQFEIIPPVVFALKNNGFLHLLTLLPGLWRSNNISNRSLSSRIGSANENPFGLSYRIVPPLFYLGCFEDR